MTDGLALPFTKDDFDQEGYGELLDDTFDTVTKYFSGRLIDRFEFQEAVILLLNNREFAAEVASRLLPEQERANHFAAIETCGMVREFYATFTANGHTFGGAMALRKDELLALVSDYERLVGIVPRGT